MSSGSGGLREGGEAAQVAEQRHDLAAVVAPGSLSSPAETMAWAELRRQETAQPADALQLLDLGAPPWPRDPCSAPAPRLALSSCRLLS